MRNFKNLLEEIYLHTKIPYIVKVNGDEIFNSINNDRLIDCKITAEVLEIGKNKICIITLEKDRNCMSLLKYLISDKLYDYFKSNEMLIKRILKGEDIEKKDIEADLKMLKETFNIITVNLDEDKLNSTKELIDKLYKNNEVVTLEYENHILLVGKFEDVLEHANSIYEAIESNIYSDCYIAYKTVYSIEDLKDAFGVTKYKVNLAKKNNLGKYIFGDKDLFLECVVDNIDKSLKSRICNEKKESLNKLDEELLRTVDMLYKSGLNLSEGAKKLYIHRNTLIYRIDKIQKLTGYDIRDFNEAVEFKILLSIYRESIKNKEK